MEWISRIENAKFKLGERVFYKRNGTIESKFVYVICDSSISLEIYYGLTGVRGFCEFPTLSFFESELLPSPPKQEP